MSSPTVPDADVPARSLLVRTTAVLGLALVVFLVALVLVLRPYLASSFEDSSAQMLRDDAPRAGSRIALPIAMAMLRKN